MSALGQDWVQEFRGAVTVCDRKGTIIAMNKTAAAIFAKGGGENLIGSNILDCHPEPARTKLKEIMDEQRTNVYTIQKRRVRRLIYQSPWYRNRRYAGYVELSFEIPVDLPHFVRD
jgi:transcriptional regulator with PAS, ATPase and Fis domain